MSGVTTGKYICVRMFPEGLYCNIFEPSVVAFLPVDGWIPAEEFIHVHCIHYQNNSEFFRLQAV